MIVKITHTIYKIDFSYERGELTFNRKRGNYKYTEVFNNVWVTKCKIEITDPLYYENCYNIIGQTICSPRDNFSKKIGRKISFQRAIQNFSRETRTILWNEFFKNIKS